MSFHGSSLNIAESNFNSFIIEGCDPQTVVEFSRFILFPSEVVKLCLMVYEAVDFYVARTITVVGQPIHFISFCDSVL